MKDFVGLGHLFVVAFLFHFSSFMVLPAITDVTMEAVCPGRDECSVAIYLSGFQNAADHVGTKRRAAAFGLLSGVSAAGFLSGTLTARFLATSSTFQVAAAVGAAGAIYLRAFVPDSGAAVSFHDGACDPLLQDSSCSSAASSSASSDEELSPRLPPYKGVLPSPSDMVALLTGSLTLSTAAMITFFYSLGEHGLQTALLYYLKAQFGYSKDEFANIMLIAGAAGMISQLTVMPIFAPIVGEEMLLIVGLLGGCTHVFLYGIAWSYWVPYFAAAFIILSAFVHPSIRTNVSKSVGSNEQGIAQGCISGISSFASILAPLVFTPLTAWFLSETTPFNFKGFSIMVAGFCTLIAFVISIRMRAARCGVSEKASIVQHEQA